MDEEVESNNLSSRTWETYNNVTFRAINKLDQKEFEQVTKYYAKIYGNILPSDKDIKILDIGCGAGHFLYFLMKNGYNNFRGIDISSDQVNFVKENITEKVELADAFDILKGKNNEYDVIVGNDFIEHIPKGKLLNIMDLIYAALKNDGIVILKTPNMAAPFAAESRYIDLTHEIGFTDKSLLQLFKISKFSNVEIYPKVSDYAIWSKKRLFLTFMKSIYSICGRRDSNYLDINLIGVAYK